MPRHSLSLRMEADMTAASRQQYFKMRGLGPNVVGVHRRRNPRIIERVDQERWNLDLAEELPRVILMVVVCRISKSISRSDDAIVEFENGSDAFQCRPFVRADSPRR